MFASLEMLPRRLSVQEKQFRMAQDPLNLPSNKSEDLLRDCHCNSDGGHGIVGRPVRFAMSDFLFAGNSIYAQTSLAVGFRNQQHIVCAQDAIGINIIVYDSTTNGRNIAPNALNPPHTTSTTCDPGPIDRHAVK